MGESRLNPGTLGRSRGEQEEKLAAARKQGWGRGPCSES